MNVPSIATEQALLFEWAEMARGRFPELDLLFAIPNGGSRHKLEAFHMKQQGVRAGVPDLFLPVARGGYHGLWIELKRQKGGRPSDVQKKWLAALTAQGYCAEICKGADSAAALIRKYLTGGIING